jgi:hypothetical protein
MDTTTKLIFWQRITIGVLLTNSFILYAYAGLKAVQHSVCKFSNLPSCLVA